MTAQTGLAGEQRAGASLNFFERYLTAWVALCIVVGIALGQFLPGPASSQVGIALGQLRAGYAGALAAWLGFTMPSVWYEPLAIAAPKTTVRPRICLSF